MNIRWFLRAKRLAQNPPSWGRVKLVLGVVAVCVALVLLERFVGWPEALTLERMPR
ncbi:hypothetical protein ACP2AV_06730 [Aliiroseovarius sp. PTFE2010]|uniref:hypothetical protein n=1 Tax=Aliiroseovarius sp. PTFE2010 TaxID=3417190 RepID=UPI003CF1E7C9